MARSIAGLRVRHAQRTTDHARSAVAERAVDFELCLSLARALLSRRDVVIAPAETLSDMAITASHGTRTLRAVLTIASRVLGGGDSFDRRVLLAVRAAAKGLLRAKIQYRSALRRHPALGANERVLLNSCVERARALIEALSAEPAASGDRASGIWTKPGALGWGDERPGVRRVQPSEQLESGMRFSTAVGDER